MTNVELARRGYEAALRGDLDAVREFLDPDVKWHGGDPSDSTACHNREQALAVMRQAFARQGIGELIDVRGGERRLSSSSGRRRMAARRRRRSPT